MKNKVYKAGYAIGLVIGIILYPFRKQIKKMWNIESTSGGDEDAGD